MLKGFFLSAHTSTCFLLWDHTSDAEGSSDLSEGTGHYRRFGLAWLTAEKTLPLWERRFREDHRPQQLLDLAKSYVGGEANADDLKGRSSELEVSITDMTDEVGGSHQYAGLAAVKVAYVAMSDEFFFRARFGG